MSIYIAQEINIEEFNLMVVCIKKDLGERHYSQVEKVLPKEGQGRVLIDQTRAVFSARYGISSMDYKNGRLDMQSSRREAEISPELDHMRAAIMSRYPYEMIENLFEAQSRYNEDLEII